MIITRQLQGKKTDGEKSRLARCYKVKEFRVRREDYKPIKTYMEQMDIEIERVKIFYIGNYCIFTSKVGLREPFIIYLVLTSHLEYSLIYYLSGLDCSFGKVCLNIPQGGNVLVDQGLQYG